MNTVDQIRRRMFDGKPIDGDVAWCKQRLRALRNWPCELTVEQQEELHTLAMWLRDHG